MGLIRGALGAQVRGMRMHGLRLALLALVGAMLAACGSSDPRPGGNGDGGGTTVFKVCGSNEEVRDGALIAFFDAQEGDTIEFCEGRFNLTTGLIIHGKRGVTIRGQGRGETILNFTGSDSSEGLNVSHSDGIVIEGLSIEDTPGNGLRVFRSRFVTLRDIRVSWSDDQGRFETDPGYTPLPENGAYALYPVETEHVLMEDCEAHGASDAGVYVGQSNDVIVRNCLATFNVAGYEFENTYRSIFEYNIARDNTGGFLVFDLPGLRQYGESNIVRYNETYRNNTDNFAPVGNIVGLVPRGTGILVLSADNVDIHDNEIYDNDTIGIAIINFALAEPNEPDMKFDFFPEGIHIRNNVFRDNGGNIQEPSLERGEASLLPLLIALKNLGTSAHIVWDGAIDTLDTECGMPVDADGIPLDQPNPNNERLEARLDQRGRPNLQRTDPEPSCRYNAWKFDQQGNLKAENGLFINDNEFENTRLRTLGVNDFVNVKLTSSDIPTLVLDLLRPASRDLSPHVGTFPLTVEQPELELPFVPNPNSNAARPSPAEVNAACNSGSGVNWAALARFNCPRLDQYRLFADAQDPTSAPQGRAVKYGMTTQLFSDYTLKDRFIFLPGDSRLGYRDASMGGPIDNRGTTATLDFPIGAVISKTFSYQDDNGENVLETRLMIKRDTAQGPTWIGLPYVWTGEGANRQAVLRLEGERLAASYNYVDPDPDVAQRYQGSVTQYGVPAALNCITCHGGDDRTAGSAPIGPKVRLLNSDFEYADGTVANQLRYMAEHGFLDGLPQDVEARERLPRWNVPGDSGHLPNSDDDIHARARAYLETNCMHCHHPNGNAANSGLYLDSRRGVGRAYGICKRPVAAGRGSGDLNYVLVPGSSERSILYFRMASNQPGVRMPPIARSVLHGEALALIQTWIDDVLPNQDINDDFCAGPLGDLPLLSNLPLPLDQIANDVIGALPDPLPGFIGGLLNGVDNVLDLLRP